MANPQKEHGYTAIANEIMEALAKYRIPGEKRQVLDFILRNIYGWKGRKKVELSYSEIAKGTDIARRNVIRSVKWLVSKRITGSVKNDTTGKQIYEFNKNYDDWEPIVKKGGGVKIDTTPSVKTDTNIGVKSDTTGTNTPIIFKTKKQNIKQLASVLYDFYKNEINSLRKSSTRAKENIAYYLKYHSFEDLKQAVLNYKLTIYDQQEGTWLYDSKHRKDPANFFGKNDRYFIDYLPDNFEPPEKDDPLARLREKYSK